MCVCAELEQPKVGVDWGHMITRLSFCHSALSQPHRCLTHYSHTTTTLCPTYTYRSMEMEHARSYQNPAPVLATEVLEKHDNTSPNTATPLGPPDEAFEGLATLIQIEQPVSPDSGFEFASPTLYDASSGSSAVSEHSGASDVEDYDFASLGAFFDWPPNRREETMAAASVSAAAIVSGAVGDESTRGLVDVSGVDEVEQSPVANNETEDYDVERQLEDMLAASGCVIDQHQPAPALDDSNEGFLTDEQFAQWMVQQAAAEQPVDVQANGNGSPLAFEHNELDGPRLIRPLPTRRPRVGVEWYGADATVEVAGEREQPTYSDDSEVAQAGPSHVTAAPAPMPSSVAHNGGSPPHQQPAGPVAYHYPQLQAAQQPGYPWPYPPVQNAYYPSGPASTGAYPVPAPANGAQDSTNASASASGNQLANYPPLPNPAPYYPYAPQPQPPIRSLAEFYQQPGRLLSSEPVSHHMTPYQNGMPSQGPVAGPSYPYPYPYTYPYPVPQPAGSASKRKADSDDVSTGQNGRRPGRPKKQPKLDALEEALSKLTPDNLKSYTECKTLRAGKHLLVCPLEGHDRYGAFSNDVEGIREHLYKAHGHEDWEQVKLRRRGHGGVKNAAVVCDWPVSDSATGTGTGTGTCGAHFDGAAKYIRHLQSEHLKDTYYRCPNVQKPSCNMTFKKKEDLAVHMAICQAEVEAEREERRRKDAARIFQ
ncbi:hypothetical protein HMN09_00553100 [Mycena chlorophos]|uniref:Uncharacterized protein n=1 Tax=Mycena chlorophos TaxID=658473 RepID=A0A8H6TC87_MYCCL|nr:hypothetical protein HMN09_00553100 [Mycena chlorophos]